MIASTRTLTFLSALCFGMAGAAHGQTEVANEYRSQLGQDLPTFDASAEQALVEPTGGLALRQALALSLLHSPRMTAFHYQVRAAEAAQLQAAAWPNLQMGLELENFAGSGIYQGSGSAETTLGLSQLVLLGGKRGKRVAAARLYNEVTLWDYEVARIGTYASTAAAFTEVLAAQERLLLAEKILEIARDLESAVTRRVQAGGTLALEQNRARSVVETTVIERQLAQRALAVARAKLVAQWGGQAPQFSEAVGDIEAVSSNLPTLTDLRHLVESSPELSRWIAEVERRGATMEMVKADRVPDLDIGLGLRHDNAVDDAALVMEISAPIPLWDRKRGAVQEAEANVEEARATQRAVTTNLQRDLAVIYERMAGAHEELTGLRERVLPEAELASAGSGEAYQAGAIRLTDVLDIQRSFYRLRLRYVDALTRYHSAVAQLEGLMGTPIHQPAVQGEQE